jgi:hypothetical protein
MHCYDKECIPAQFTHDQMPYMSPYVYGDAACCDWNVWDPIGCDSWCKMQTDASGYRFAPHTR